MYFSFIHSYLNYGNIVWASTNKSKLSVLLKQQKHAARLIHFKDKYTHAKPLLQNLKTLNIYQLNILQTLFLMHKIKNHNIPTVFKRAFSIYTNKYNTKSTNISFFKTRCNQCSITFRGPHIWNFLIPRHLQDLPFHTFKNKLNQLILNLNDEDQFF